MSYEARLLRHEDLDPAVTTAWDELPPTRGIQADFYDSHAWLAAWSQMVGPRALSELRVPAVMDGDRLVALLPLEAHSTGHWASVGAGALQTHRKRYRPVLAGEPAGPGGARPAGRGGRPGRRP